MNNPPNGFVPSYVHGAEVTAARRDHRQALDRAAARWADRTALVVRAQGIRWT